MLVVHATQITITGIIVFLCTNVPFFSKTMDFVRHSYIARFCSKRTFILHESSFVQTSSQHPVYCMIQLQQEVCFVPLLQSFYKASQAKFEEEESGFKAKAQQAVVRLQVSVLILNVQFTAMTLLILIYKQYLNCSKGKKDTKLHGKKYVKTVALSLSQYTNALVWSLKKRYFIYFAP